MEEKVENPMGAETRTGKNASNPYDGQFKELLEAAPDAIMQVDREGRITLLNRVTEKMFGYSREELLGQPIEILVPQPLRGQHAGHRKAYHAKPMTRAMGMNLALEGQRKDGSRFPVEISLSPSVSKVNFRVTAIIRDITERKQAQDRLKQVREEYVAKLADQNQELELRNREIERANRLKSDFLASMSHELRTPLHTIVGFSELLGEELEGPLNAKQKRFVQHIHKDSLHLLDLINDILDLSKIEAGRLELHPEVFDVASVVEESFAAVRRLAEAKSLRLSSSVELDQGIEADRLRLKQVLVNLLSNAVKFTPENGAVDVRAAELQRDGETWLSVEVTDTGIGIDEAELVTIFDKFHQVSATTKGVREGTGLGLAITRHLVESHRGMIVVTSQPGQGSCFRVELPVRYSSAGMEKSKS